MRLTLRTLGCLAAISMLAACAHDGNHNNGRPTTVTPVSEVKLPPQTVRIAGKIIGKKTTVFTLRDNSGKIMVDTDSAKAVRLLKVGETVAVDGVLDDTPETINPKKGMKEFDAFIIHRADGTAIQLVKMEKQYHNKGVVYHGGSVKKAVKNEAKKEVVKEVQKH